MSRPPQRPIARLLVANRGEIATRIIASAREVGLVTYAIYTAGDDSHAVRADYAIKLDSAASFMNMDGLIKICKEHQIDAVHPGYGFLSESGDLSRRMWHEAGVAVVGPGWGILEKTGDKLKARQLAEECQVPVAAALLTPTNSIQDVHHFASQVGYPIMVKAVDGGGGRGIRLIREESQLASLVKRAVEESPSKQVFAEKAAVDGFRHVEVQIVGDGTGNVTHLWERECSIQRRYQKVVELAPSVVSDRGLIARMINDALKMARHIQYFSLGTFEFLVNPVSKAYYFLEINPRLQVEHTITESISTTDIVQAQLLLAQGATLQTCGLPTAPRDPINPPSIHSLQLRITAENVPNNWSLSIGKITSFQLPTGNGIRTDTHLLSHRSTIVGADFDSLLAKIIVTASTWPAVVRKAQRALDDTRINGITTNLAMLKAIVSHPDFLNRACDTQWLERNQTLLLQQHAAINPSPQHAHNPLASDTNATTISPNTSLAPPNTLFRKGDAWSLVLSPITAKTTTTTTTSTPTPTTTTTNSPHHHHHLRLTHIHYNDFPNTLTAQVLVTSPAATTATTSHPHPPPPTSTPYTLHLTSTHTSAPALTSPHRRADASNATHVGIPFPGTLVELLVQPGDVVGEGAVLCVVRQMKMEVEVRAPRGGRVGWVMEVEEGEEVGEGWLVAVVLGEDEGEMVEEGERRGGGGGGGAKL